MGHDPGGLAGLVTAGKSRQQSKLLLFFRNDLAGCIQVRCQLNVGIADEFVYQLALRFHTVLFVVLGYSFFLFFPAKFNIML
jgi:hypothetical protein